MTIEASKAARKRRRIAYLVGLVLTPVASLCACFGGGIVMFLIGRTPWGTSPLAVVGIGLVATGFLSWFLMLQVGLFGWPTKRNPVATLTTILLLTCLLLPPIIVFALVPPTRPTFALNSAPAGKWVLPSGSEIAYYYTKSGGRGNAQPVLFISDGPGAADSQVQNWLVHVAQTGHDIYSYDQVGTGMSSRLRDPREYTADRMLEDLGHIKSQLSDGPVILVGYGSGAPLAATFAGEHTRDVSGLILISPSSYPGDDPNLDIESRLTPAQRSVLEKRTVDFRAMLARVLLVWAPQISSAVIPDKELDSWATTRAELLQPVGNCNSVSLRRPQATSGAFAQLAAGSYWKMGPESANKIASLHIPTLIVRGTCDYVPWEVAKKYRSTIADAKLVNLSKQGHDLGYTSGATLTQLVEAFLTQTNLPLPTYHGDADPSQS